KLSLPPPALTHLTVPCHLTGALQPFTNRPQLTAQEGDSLTLLCTVDSNPPASLSWVRDPGNLSLSLGNRLELLNVTSKDRGEYRCQAQNTEGSTEMTFQLIVQGTSSQVMIELICKLVFAVAGFLLAYYLTLLYYKV
uniref:Ig-like domain-containing protein n=1 Tax=Sphenodon punctatus TaxID=8508 RepID=A0A8D0HG19_SPHPU